MIRHTRKILTKIVDELVTHCYSLGASEVQINLSDDDKAHYIAIKSDFSHDEIDRVNELKNHLNTGRCKDMEEMYWNLAGMSDLDDEVELQLVNSLIDEAIIQVEDDHFTLKLTRYRG